MQLVYPPEPEPRLPTNWNVHRMVALDQALGLRDESSTGSSVV
jgi:hypothetical protein